MPADRLAVTTPLREHRRAVFACGSLRGHARHLDEVVDHNSSFIKMPGAEGWADALTGVYRRIH